MNIFDKFQTVIILSLHMRDFRKQTMYRRREDTFLVKGIFLTACLFVRKIPI